MLARRNTKAVDSDGLSTHPADESISKERLVHRFKNLLLFIKRLGVKKSRWIAASNSGEGMDYSKKLSETSLLVETFSKITDSLWTKLFPGQSLDSQNDNVSGSR